MAGRECCRHFPSDLRAIIDRRRLQQQHRSHCQDLSQLIVQENNRRVSKEYCRHPREDHPHRMDNCRPSRENFSRSNENSRHSRENCSHSCENCSHSCENFNHLRLSSCHSCVSSGYSREELSHPPVSSCHSREDSRPREDFRHSREGLRPRENFRQREGFRLRENIRPREDPHPPKDFRSHENSRLREDSRHSRLGFRPHKDFRSREDSRPQKDFRPPGDPRPQKDFRSPEDSRSHKGFRPREDSSCSRLGFRPREDSSCSRLGFRPREDSSCSRLGFRPREGSRHSRENFGSHEAFSQYHTNFHSSGDDFTTDKMHHNNWKVKTEVYHHQSFHNPLTRRDSGRQRGNNSGFTHEHRPAIHTKHVHRVCLPQRVGSTAKRMLDPPRSHRSDSRIAAERTRIKTRSALLPNPNYRPTTRSSHNSTENCPTINRKRADPLLTPRARLARLEHLRSNILVKWKSHPSSTIRPRSGIVQSRALRKSAVTLPTRKQFPSSISRSYHDYADRRRTLTKKFKGSTHTSHNSRIPYNLHTTKDSRRQSTRMVSQSMQGRSLRKTSTVVQDLEHLPSTTVQLRSPENPSTVLKAPEHLPSSRPSQYIKKEKCPEHLPSTSVQVRSPEKPPMVLKGPEHLPSSRPSQYIKKEPCLEHFPTTAVQVRSPEKNSTVLQCPEHLPSSRPSRYIKKESNQIRDSTSSGFGVTVTSIQKEASTKKNVYSVVKRLNLNSHQAEETDLSLRLPPGLSDVSVCVPIPDSTVTDDTNLPQSLELPPSDELEQMSSVSNSSSTSSESKRIPEDSVVNNDVPQRNKMIQDELLRLGPVSTVEEMNIEVLRAQHAKLKQRLEQRQKQELDLLDRILQLEDRQTQDDAVLNVINRYWNQLNEDISFLLQRFDTDSSDDTENKNDSEATTSFLTQLSTWDKTELDEKLANRVQVSKKAVAKIIQAFDVLQQRNEKVTKGLKGELEDDSSLIEDIIKKEYFRIGEENKILVSFNNHLKEKLLVMGSEFATLTEKLTGEETNTDELKNQVEDLEWEVNKLIGYNDKLTNHIQDLSEKYRRLQQMSGEANSNNKKEKNVEISDTEVINLRKEIEELREQAANRLTELDRLHKMQRETLKELEKLRIDIRQLPESVIVETTEYKCLQSKFSVIYNDTLQLRGTLDETRTQLFTMRTTHMKHIEQMESEELLGQKKLRTEMIQLEDMLGVVRKEYEMLRLEFEQNLAAHEQSGPINREMRHLITSLQNHNQQLKGDCHRYKRKYKESCNENAKIKKQKDEIEAKIRDLERATLSRNSDAGVENEDAPISSSNSCHEHNGQSVVIKQEPDDSFSSEDGDFMKVEKPLGEFFIKKEIKKEPKSPVKVSKAESEAVKDLRAQVKKALHDQKEMKLVLDMYKGHSKDPRDKSQLENSEKKCRQELEDVRSGLKKLQEGKKDEKRKLADEEALKRIKGLEDTLHTLQRQIQNQKTEEDALVSEMEVTGQAFEDMQEQNARLIQQLREKDEANFKLLSDRVKASQFQKLAMEERELLQEHAGTLSKQVDAQNHVVRKLEEKERLLLNVIATMETEGMYRQQAMELHKRKAIESAQSAADLKLHLEKYHSQMKDAQCTVAEKTSALESEAYKTKRLQEHIALLKRKVERLNKIEMAGNTDEVMMEEIREFRETLTCPSCKVKQKDAVLIKCFHVFCFDCLRTRYETRQRKCPKCNAAFGANDYHRLYLA